MVGIDVRAAEAMNSMEEDVFGGQGMAIDGGVDYGMTRRLVQRDEGMEVLETGKYLLGKAYFDCKEYDRAAFSLKGCVSYKSHFLRLYSKFLVRRKVCKRNSRPGRNGERMMVRRFWVCDSGDGGDG